MARCSASTACGGRARCSRALRQCRLSSPARTCRPITWSHECHAGRRVSPLLEIVGGAAATEDADLRAGRSWRWPASPTPTPRRSANTTRSSRAAARSCSALAAGNRPPCRRFARAVRSRDGPGRALRPRARFRSRECPPVVRGRALASRRRRSGRRPSARRSAAPSGRRRRDRAIRSGGPRIVYTPPPREFQRATAPRSPGANWVSPALSALRAAARDRPGCSSGRRSRACHPRVSPVHHLGQELG